MERQGGAARFAKAGARLAKGARRVEPNPPKGPSPGLWRPPGAPFPFGETEKGGRRVPRLQRIGRAERWLSHFPAPQSRRGDIGAFADRAQLEPDRRLDHPFSIGERAEAA